MASKAGKDSKPDGSAKVDNEERLVWLMNHNEQYQISFLTPRLQKLTKAGKWSKGRPVALKKLYKNTGFMAGLTDQDRQICRNGIKESHYGDGYYAKVEYSIDDTRAFPLLVGHPLVFLEESLATPVELVKGEPEIRIRVQGKKIHISMEPALDSEIKRDLRVVRETPSRFKIISLSDVHSKIAELLGNKGLELPESAKAKVTQAVAALSSLVAVNSDLAGAGNEGVKRVKATGTVVIDDELSLDLIKLMALLESSSGRFVTLDDGTFLAITHSLKERLEELRAYSTVHGNGLRFTPLAAPAIEELTGQVGSLTSDKIWKAHCRKLKEVLAPLSVGANWQDECHNFAPTFNPLVFGPGDRKVFLDGLGPFDLVISSYGLLQVEGEKLADVQWQVVVLDEAQAIKNMRSKRSKAAMKLSARFRMITTGTLVENHLDELWTLFNFLNPGLLGTFKRFKEIFALPIERDQDKDASRRLRKLIRPFILRRLKSDVLTELPQKTEITLQVEMSPEEALLYEAQRIKALENIDKANGAPGQKHFRILAELMKLRQLCCNPSLVLPQAGIESSKLKVFGDVVTELLANNHKALVFSQFVGHLAILRKFLDAKEISYQYLDGSTPAKERQVRIKAFQNGEGDLFLISFKAGGFGLNLTAADYVIHMDPWWNPAVEDQASDRAHRMGQTRPVTVYRLVVKGSIEEQIVKLHKEKRDLAEGLLAGSEMAGKMSASALLGLLKRGSENPINQSS